MTKVASALEYSFSSFNEVARETSTSVTCSEACCSATRVAASQSLLWTCISMASLGASALINSASASSNLPSSSRYIACLR